MDVLLNPCFCKDVWNCKCRNQASGGINAPNSEPSASSSSIFNDGLSALAHVAACCSPAPPTKFYTDEERQAVLAGTDRPGSRAIRPNCPHPHSKKPGTQTSNVDLSGSLLQTQNTDQEAGPSSYTPIKTSAPTLETEQLGSTSTPPFPFSPDFPSSSAVTTSRTSPAQVSFCGCGLNCACVGCAQHAKSHGPGSPTTGRSVPVHRANCAHDCPTCVDQDGGVELPGHKPQSTFLDQFFARAAALPSPPMASRARSASLDPTNVFVYPPALLNAKEAERDVRGLAFGLVNIPKLECCGGKCSCPDDSCSCGNECNGCCADDGDDKGEGSSTQVRSPVHRHKHKPLPIAKASSEGVKRSCCS